MLDIPGQPVLNKDFLVGGCVRLPLRVDAARLRSEIASLPASLWGTTGGRVGVHMAAEALFLRGFAPAEGDKVIADREALAVLPYVKTIITDLVPAPPQRCLLARMAGGASIAPHIDRAPYFSKTLRMHVPVATHEQVWMMCAGLCYSMREGELWMLNNCALHAVWNAHASASRTHLICDFLPTPALLDLLAHGERHLGRQILHVERHFARHKAGMVAGGG
jgi:hypothetical protein